MQSRQVFIANTSNRIFCFLYNRMIQTCTSLQKLKIEQYLMNHDYILLTVSLGPISPSKLVWSAVSKRGPISDYLFFSKLNNNVFNSCVFKVSKMPMFKMNLWRQTKHQSVYYTCAHS